MEISAEQIQAIQEALQVVYLSASSLSSETTVAFACMAAGGSESLENALVQYLHEDAYEVGADSIIEVLDKTY